MAKTTVQEGDLDRAQRDRRFVCTECGEIFIAPYADYEIADERDRDKLGVAAWSVCPTCGTPAVSPVGSAGEVATVTGLKILSLPAQALYKPGDLFDPTGLVIASVWNNGAQTAVDVSDLTFSPTTSTPLTASDDSITVTLTGTEHEIDVPIAVYYKLVAKPILLKEIYVYNGQEQFVEVRGYDSSAMTRSGASHTNVGTYTTTYTLKTGYMWDDGTTAAVQFKTYIVKAVPVVTAPEPKDDLVYTGEAQELVTAGSTTGGTLQYKVGSGSYGTSVPTGTDAGTYTVSYKVVGGTNYEDVAEQTLPAITIGKATPEVVAPVAESDLTYTGSEQALVTAGSTTGGTMEYSVNGSTYGESVPVGENAGSYVVSYRVTGTSNYESVAAVAMEAINIAKAAAATPTLSVDTLSLTAIATPGEITVTRDGDGVVSAVSSDETVATVSVDGATVTVTAVADGSATVTVSVAEGTNYLAPETSPTCAVTVALE